MLLTDADIRDRLTAGDAVAWTREAILAAHIGTEAYLLARLVDSAHGVQ